MRLERVHVEHFGCIRHAELDLGPGLNVLYGPNDLGKSTLARAIRAALLIQHSSAAADAFSDWESDERPFVELTLQLPDRRIWRVEKRFGTAGGASVLRESKDGAIFSPYKKGREVDEEIRSALGWGIASPANPGAPRGLPTSFLATVLLGEQADVTAVLRQTLDADSDESGRRRLTEALAAFAQDPLFKQILDEAQARVDEAYTGTGRRRGGKGSPFKAATDEVKRCKELLDRADARVDETENAQRELADRQAALEHRRDALERAIEQRDRQREIVRQTAERRAIEDELAAARQRLDAQQAQIDELGRQQQRLVEVYLELAAETRSQAAQRTRRAELIDERSAAEEALRHAKGGEAERERQLRQGELDRRRLELDAEHKEHAGTLERVRTARRLSKEIAEIKRRLGELETARETSAAAMQHAERVLRDAADERDRVELAVRLARRRDLAAAIERLERIATDARRERDEAASRRAHAKTLTGRLVEGLPERAALSGLRAIEQALELAEARLGGGLTVVVQRHEPLELAARADGAALDHGGQADTLTLEAERELELELGSLANLRVIAGARDACEEVERLRTRRAAEIQPLLEHFGAPDLATISALLDENDRIQQEIRAALSEADALDERARLRLDQVADLEDERRALAALDAELADCACDEAQALLDGSEDLQARRARVDDELEQARMRRDQASDAARIADADARVLATELAGKRKALEALGLGRPAEGWDGLEARLVAHGERLEDQRKQVSDALERLASGRHEAVDRAEASLRRVIESLEAVTAELDEAARSLEGHQRAASRLGGVIEMQSKQVANLDVTGTKREIAAIEQRLAKQANPRRAVTPDELAKAEEAVTLAERECALARDEVRKAEGALQTVGGQVAREEQRIARDAYELACQRERAVETEYAAWRLLADKLREAENSEGCHLGLALSQPVSERFSALTASRYGPLEVESNLQSAGLRVAGVVREVERLSVGTQEQLATLLRLTVAEHLASALVLDDHLTQTDPARTAWFRQVLEEHATKAQVIVLTCRPLDYLLADDLPAAGEASVERREGRLRVVDLTRIIERGGMYEGEH